MHQHSFLTTISACELLTDIDPSKINYLVKTYSKHDYVYSNIDDIFYLGIVVHGNISVYTISLDGIETKINELDRHAVFGIANLFDNRELETNLKCNKDTTVLFIDKDQIMSLMHAHPGLISKCLTLYNKKIQFLLKRIEHLTIQSCRSKLLHFLLTYNTNEINLQSSKEELAKELGISRAALFRELAFLQNNNYIKIHNSHITIINSTALSNLLYQK